VRFVALVVLSTLLPLAWGWFVAFLLGRLWPVGETWPWRHHDAAPPPQDYQI
jgi:hypothetical protein